MIIKGLMMVSMSNINLLRRDTEIIITLYVSNIYNICSIPTKPLHSMLKFGGSFFASLTKIIKFILSEFPLLNKDGLVFSTAGFATGTGSLNPLEQEGLGGDKEVRRQDSRVKTQGQGSVGRVARQFIWRPISIEG